MGKKKTSSDDVVAAAISAAFPDASITRRSEVCSLWAGYGSIYRVILSGESSSSVIVKHIVAPSSAASSVSNKRKLDSYAVEGYFYAHLSAASTLARLPHVHSMTASAHAFCFVLEDLAPAYPKSFHSLGGATLETALTWLAHFHATYWNVRDDNVAETGGYWYLATRQDELDAMGNDPYSAALKAQAAAIDRHTRAFPQFETLLHGDAKSANMLWADDRSCAWVDFQYVGRGLGAKDLAYMLCSSTSRADVARADDHLRFYFDAFDAAMTSLGNTSHGYTVELLLDHFDWCLLDYVRFMAGWGYWGNYDWAIQRTKHLLA
ncbi:Aste57867_13676 [Aphanomyces stellatus]|uniref:Aste57867_13676 protein n=1 Tax=Aphanomyces stellatus TaxID=120398 RepID=A0A485KYR7_9STRA|nr:hypothetical protein As57867_013626 [Aphanomyces stellatus]VFT90509.1 Aste57867_13676 [Aphanomyces stellatus]